MCLLIGDVRVTSRCRCRRFQFVWMSEVDEMQGVLAREIDTPVLLVLNPETRTFYASNISAKDMYEDNIRSFLHDYMDGKIEV